MDINKVLEKARLITFIVAASLIAVVGIFFLVLSDLGLKNTATWLMFSVLLSFGSAFACFFSEIRKDKPVLVYALKVLGLLLMIGFIIYLIQFGNSSVCTSINESHKFMMYLGSKKIEILRIDILSFMMTTSYILTGLGIGIQAVNIGLNLYLGIKE